MKVDLSVGLFVGLSVHFSLNFLSVWFRLSVCMYVCLLCISLLCLSGYSPVSVLACYVCPSINLFVCQSIGMFVIWKSLCANLPAAIKFVNLTVHLRQSACSSLILSRQPVFQCLCLFIWLSVVGPLHCLYVCLFVLCSCVSLCICLSVRFLKTKCLLVLPFQRRSSLACYFSPSLVPFYRHMWCFSISLRDLYQIKGSLLKKLLIEMKFTSNQLDLNRAASKYSPNLFQHFIFAFNSANSYKMPPHQ